MNVDAYWLSTFPPCPLVDYSGGPDDARSSFKPDKGPSISRRSFTGTILRISPEFAFTKAQYKLFVSWFEDTLKNGSEKFSMRDPFTGDVYLWQFSASGSQPYNVQFRTADLAMISFELVRSPSQPWYAAYVQPGSNAPPQWVADWNGVVYGISGAKVPAASLPTIAGPYDVYTKDGADVETFQNFLTVIAGDIPAAQPVNVNSKVGFVASGTAPPPAAESHRYDMVLPANYINIGGEVDTLSDLDAVPLAADWTQTTVALRPPIVTAPEPAMQFNASEYMRNTGHGPLVQSNNFEVSIRFNPATVTANNGLFGFGPVSGNGRVEAYIDVLGRLRLRVMNVSNAQVSSSASAVLSRTVSGAPFLASTWQTIKLAFHDNIMDYWADLTPVVIGQAFDMSAQDAVYGLSFLGARVSGGAPSLQMSGMISSFSVLEYVP